MKRNILIALVMALVFSLSAVTASASGNYGQHTVKKGENLYKIGLQYCVSWTELAQLNNLWNPNVIYAGQVLTVPLDRCTNPGSGVYDRGPRSGAQGTVSFGHYTVYSGDRLYRIGQRFGVSMHQIAEANNISLYQYIYPGQQLVIPGLVSI